MTTEDRQPRLGKSAFECPHCQSFAQQEVGSLFAQWGPAKLHELESQIGPGTRLGWSVTRCQACLDVAVWHGGAMRYPAGPSLAPPRAEMPEGARELYTEAIAVFGHSKRAAAALARASLESLLREVGIEGGRLDDLIAAARPRVTESVWQLLTALRVVGNTSLHEGGDANGLIAVYLDESDADVAEALINAVNLATDALVIEPARASRIYALIPEGKRKAAESKIPDFDLEPVDTPEADQSAAE